MSARAPISGDDEFRNQFSKADTDPSFGYLTVKINFDTNKFQIAKYASNENGDTDAMFKNMLSECQVKEHTYFIIRDPTNKNSLISQDDNNDTEKKDNEASKSKTALNLYILIHYA